MNILVVDIPPLQSSNLNYVLVISDVSGFNNGKPMLCRFICRQARSQSRQALGQDPIGHHFLLPSGYYDSKLALFEGK